MELRNAALLSWYDHHGRDLPWRHTKDRWAILVSEVMLQQTQVNRVIPAYHRFMTSYPTPDDFAGATPEEVISTWGDLGYLRRARNLHAAAREVRDSGWPRDLTALAGVGPYTAAAVRSFADGEVIAAADVNLRRVLSRWAGRPLSARQSQIVGNEEIATSRPADWNQAMMDLGATVCRPRQPRCGVCPVSDWCEDPSIIVTARPQSQYAGSVRQARAAVLKTLAGGPVAWNRLDLGLDPEMIDRAVNDLKLEGAVIDDGAMLRLG